MKAGAVFFSCSDVCFTLRASESCGEERSVNHLGMRLSWREDMLRLELNLTSSIPPACNCKEALRARSVALFGPCLRRSRAVFVVFCARWPDGIDYRMIVVHATSCLPEGVGWTLCCRRLTILVDDVLRPFASAWLRLRRYAV